MTRYAVIATRELTYSATVLVEADSKEDAAEIAQDQIHDIEIDWEASDSWATKPDIDLWNIEADA